MAPVQTPAELPASAAVSRKLIESIAQLDQPLTGEKAAEIKQNIAQIISQGQAAIPAITQFLEEFQDLSFVQPGGQNQVGYGSLRAALFDSLGQIGGPEAESVLVNVLRTTADPSEIALLARNLEGRAPGQYRFEVLNATRETLEDVIAGQLNLGDVGPLFRVLQTYGDASVIADLQSAHPQWRYYATMSLAALPDGLGIPALIQQAQWPTGDRFALQMLAQIAGSSSEASATLIEQATLNQIPDRAWQNIAAGLAGDQYQLQRTVGDPNVPNSSIPGFKSYHIQSGNQIFYSVPVSASFPSEEIVRRQSLIEQLLSMASSPVAIQALRNARAQLSAIRPPA